MTGAFDFLRDGMITSFYFTILLLGVGVLFRRGKWLVVTMYCRMYCPFLFQYTAPVSKLQVYVQRGIYYAWLVAAIGSMFLFCISVSFLFNGVLIEQVMHELTLSGLFLAGMIRGAYKCWLAKDIDEDRFTYLLTVISWSKRFAAEIMHGRRSEIFDQARPNID